MNCPGCGAPDDQGCYKNCPEVKGMTPQKFVTRIEKLASRWIARADKLEFEAGEWDAKMQYVTAKEFRGLAWAFKVAAKELEDGLDAE